MKKILFFAAATLTLAACSNNDNYIDQPIVAQISATINNSAASRASGTTWAKGDGIGITMTGNLVSYVNQKYTTGDGDGIFAGTAMYFKNHIDPMTLTAYYPFSGFEDTAPEVFETSTLAERQTDDDQPNFDFLYAKLENVTGRNPNVEFKFAHKMSKVTFVFEDGNGAEVRKITSYQIDGLVLEGTFNPATGDCAAKDTDPASLRMTTEGVESGKMLPSLLLFPQSTAGKTVTLRIKDSENQDYACTLNFGDDGLVSGNNYLYTIKVSKTGLSVNSSITDWVTEELGGEAKSDDSDDSDDSDE